jgi:hypothetical protein
MTRNLHRVLNLGRFREDPLMGWKFIAISLNWRVAMPTVVRFPQSISTSSVMSGKAEARRAERDLFVSVALFSGVGLLISLLAILSGFTAVWY